MIELLTLSIAETNPSDNKFAVVAMEMRSKKILSLDLEKREIIDEKGNVFWDIGFISCVKEIESNNSKNPLYKATGVSLGEDKLSSLKSILDKMVVSAEKFHDDKRQIYGVVKVSKVEDLTDNTENIIKHYLKVHLYGAPKPHKLLNKDYRWVNFWNIQIKNDRNIDECKDKYKKMLNGRDKTLYLILYRHFYSNNDMVWIRGMHLL